MCGFDFYLTLDVLQAVLYLFPHTEALRILHHQRSGRRVIFIPITSTPHNDSKHTAESMSDAVADIVKAQQQNRGGLL